MCVSVFVFFDAGKRKRGRDDDFLDALREIQKSTDTVLRTNADRCDVMMQHMYDLHVQDKDFRTQQLALVQAEAAESRRALGEFQSGFMTVFSRIAENLCRSNSPRD